MRRSNLYEACASNASQDRPVPLLQPASLMFVRVRSLLIAAPLLLGACAPEIQPSVRMSPNLSAETQGALIDCRTHDRQSASAGHSSSRFQGHSARRRGTELSLLKPVAKEAQTCRTSLERTLSVPFAFDELRDQVQVGWSTDVRHFVWPEPVRVEEVQEDRITLSAAGVLIRDLLEVDVQCSSFPRGARIYPMIEIFPGEFAGWSVARLSLELTEGANCAFLPAASDRIVALSADIGMVVQKMRFGLPHRLP